MNLIFFLIFVLLCVIDGIVLFKLGQRKNSALFYILTVLSLLAITIIIFKNNVLSLMFIKNIGWFWIIIFVERLAWIISLKNASEEDKFYWFMIILHIPIIGWLFYKITQIR